MIPHSVDREEDGRLDEALRESFPASDAYVPSREEESNLRGAHIANLNQVLAELIALYVATKGCHWHVSGSHFRDYHQLLDAQAVELLATTDPVAERVRKLGATTLSSLAEIDTGSRGGPPVGGDVPGMLRWLLDANRGLCSLLRETHRVSGLANDIATAGLVETWIDQSEGRSWFLAEITGPQA